MTASHFSGPLAAELADFVAFLKASGSGCKTTITMLRALDSFTLRRPLLSRTIDEEFARDWLAPCKSRGPNTQRARYYLLRRFCRFAARRCPDTFVPGESLRPRSRPPKPPHIYSQDEIRLLLDAALSLHNWTEWHPCPLRSQTVHAVILLLVTSGLRISEALHLTMEAVDLDTGVLSINQSKFRKSRVVPVSPGTLSALRSYHDLRALVTPAGPESAFFVSGRGKAYAIGTMQGLFRNLAIQVGLRGAKGHGPHLHDLRATFAVTRLLLWYRDGSNVMSRLPLLSTYLGHACIADTEVYLRISTALLQEASARFHSFAHDLFPTGGQS
jgi:integrase